MQVNIISPGDVSSGPNFQTLDAARSLNAPRGVNVPSVEALKGFLQESFKRMHPFLAGSAVLSTNRDPRSLFVSSQVE